jgi:hypothetical protein
MDSTIAIDHGENTTFPSPNLPNSCVAKLAMAFADRLASPSVP